MTSTYHQCARRLWHVHGVAPLRASDIALYFLLMHEAYRNGWRMPIHIANGLIVPMLFEIGTLKQSRKRLVEHGLIEYTMPRGNTTVPSYKIVGIGDCDTTDDEANDDLFVKAVNRLWTAFDDIALNASEIALYFYVLNAADCAGWQQPVRFRDAAIAPLLMNLSALGMARDELARRRLITFDLGDPKRNVPKYSIVTDDKLTSPTTARPASKSSASEKKTTKQPGKPTDKQPTSQPDKQPVGQPDKQPVEQPSSGQQPALPEKPQPTPAAAPASKPNDIGLRGQHDIHNNPEDYKNGFNS